ncbi:MAG: hypothetical protein AAGK97_09570 [Bacteroidota bacterium]
MKKLLTSITLIFWFLGLKAQTGIQVLYTNPDMPEWENILPNQKNNVTVAVDYWFRLKNIRIEFLPEISLGSYNFNAINSVNSFNKVKTDHLGFHFNTNFYIFDLAGDCDCPTFSKEGNSLKKGFFIQLGPGISYFSHTLTDENVINVESNTFGISIQGGVGIDIGISDFLTITPLFKIRYAPQTEGKGYTAIIAPNDTGNFDKTSVTTYNFGIRLGLHWDELNRF